jgi:hypothetical protein
MEMVEKERIQLRGFHNTYDENGNADGFEFCLRTAYYKGLWLSQFRVGDVIVDGEVFPKNTIIWNFYGIDYMPEEMYDRMDIYWQMNDLATVKVKKKGGLPQGYHDVDVKLGWVCNYNSETEKEYDGSGLGNSAGMFGGAANQRRMLLAR